MSLVELPTLQLQPVVGYEHDVRVLFRQTLILGKPIEGHLTNFDLYETMCLDWYLTQESSRAAVVVDVDSKELMGYALVCAMPGDYRRWLRAQVARVAKENIRSLLLGKMSSLDRKFYGLRLLDTFTVAFSRSHSSTNLQPHAHLNIVDRGRTGSTALMLIGHIDEMCLASGYRSWIGEVNAIGGKRERALSRLVGDILEKRKNRTATYFVGKPVFRLTVRRDIAR